MTARGRIRTQPGDRRVRVFLGGEVVADTTTPLLVWEKPYYPTYYFPASSVRTELLAPTGETTRSPSRGTADVLTVAAGGSEAPGAAQWFRESPLEELTDHVRFEWEAMDAWFEEDEEVYVHAKDPNTRIDIRESSRHVRVEIDGVTIAETTHPRFLFETGLPRRSYIPKTDVRMDLLTATDTTTRCPYKGTAEYYSVTVDGTTYGDIVWWYRHPVPESQAIAGLVAFYDEKVDVYVDGELQERPKTIFS